jgi:hypothetical protein
MQELAATIPSPGSVWSTNVTPRRFSTPSSKRHSCPGNHLPHSDDPRKAGRSVDGGRSPPIEDARFLSAATTLASSDPAPSRYAALEAALDFFDARSERYNAVHEMLHFLDAQAERRTSAASV